MNSMIRNPYAKKAPTASIGQKRNERPWDRDILTSTGPSREKTNSSSTQSIGGRPPLPVTIQRDPLTILETSLPSGVGQSLTTKKATSAKVLASDLPQRPSSQPILHLSQEHGKRPTGTYQSSSLPRPESWNGKASAIANPRSAPPSPATSTTSEAVDPRQKSLPRELQFSLEVTQPIQDEYRADLVRHAALSEPLANGWTLYSHQKRAILVSLLMRRHILALDMGLGKTLIGCCWARAFHRTIPDLRVVILCPVSLKDEWLRTSKDVTGLSVQSEETNKNSKRKPPSQDQSHDSGAGAVTIVSWAKIPDPKDVLSYPEQPFVVVADEAHSMQNTASARTRDALRLMLAPNAKGVLLLTGTPMKNGRPANLFPLLKAVKHPFGKHQRIFEAYFCGGRDVTCGGRTVWMASGAANLDQLRTLTQSHMLHMTKDDCLKNLPKQTRVFKEVPVSSRSQMRHNEAMQKLAKVYEQRNELAQQEAILGAVQNLRMVDSLAKIDATVEIAKEVLSKEAAVVIFTSFVDVAKMVHSKLSDSGWNGEILTGETPAKKRQAMVDKFQNGLSPVFVCTFGAGGVGLTLTAASTVILLDRPWTPGDAHQAEDRVRRIGQTKPVTSIWMTAFELDKQIDEMLASKSQTSSTVLSSQGAATNITSNAPKLSIFKLLHAIVPQANESLLSQKYKQTSIVQYTQGSPLQLNRSS